jgi:hypothetical protein
MPTKDGTIIDVRNDVHHPNITHISKDEFDEIESLVKSIISAISVEMPVIGQVGEQNEYGAYSVELLQPGPDREIDVMTAKELTEGEIYYFPHDLGDRGPVPEIDGERIQTCRSDELLESIDSHSQITVRE